MPKFKVAVQNNTASTISIKRIIWDDMQGDIDSICVKLQPSEKSKTVEINNASLFGNCYFELEFYDETKQIKIASIKYVIKGKIGIGEQLQAENLYKYDSYLLDITKTPNDLIFNIGDLQSSSIVQQGSIDFKNNNLQIETTLFFKNESKSFVQFKLEKVTDIEFVDGNPSFFLLGPKYDEIKTVGKTEATLVNRNDSTNNIKVKTKSYVSGDCYFAFSITALIKGDTANPREMGLDFKICDFTITGKAEDNFRIHTVNNNPSNPYNQRADIRVNDKKIDIVIYDDEFYIGGNGKDHFSNDDKDLGIRGKKIARFAYYELVFNKQNSIANLNIENELKHFVEKNKIKNLVFFAHGLNTNPSDARNVYTTYFDKFVDFDNEGKLDEKIGVCGIIWSSKRTDQSDIISAAKRLGGFKGVEFVASDVGKSFAKFINKFRASIATCKLHLTAHSLGCHLTIEALRDIDNNLISSVFLIQGATLSKNLVEVESKVDGPVVATKSNNDFEVNLLWHGGHLDPSKSLEYQALGTVGPHGRTLYEPDFIREDLRSSKPTKVSKGKAIGINCNKVIDGHDDYKKYAITSIHLACILSKNSNK